MPADKTLSFAANPPLAVTSPVEASPGKWTASVSLPACPADPSKPLAVWPLINNEVLRKLNGDQIQRLVLPQCSTVAKLSVLTSADSLVAEPGGMVEFEVQVSTDDDLTVTGRRADAGTPGPDGDRGEQQRQGPTGQGRRVRAAGTGKGSPLTVKVTAQTTTRARLDGEHEGLGREPGGEPAHPDGACGLPADGPGGRRRVRLPYRWCAGSPRCLAGPAPGGIAPLGWIA